MMVELVRFVCWRKDRGVHSLNATFIEEDTEVAHQW